MLATLVDSLSWSGAWPGVLAQAGPPSAETGPYLGLLKIIGMFVVVIPWFAAAPWVYADAKQVGASRSGWSLGVLGSGAAAFVLWLLLPIYFVGLIVFAVLAGSVLVAYVIRRNGQVPPEQKVLTPAHILSLFGKGGLARAAGDAVTKLKLYNSLGKPVLPPLGEKATAEEVNAYNLAQNLLYDIVWHRAERADLVPGSQKTRLVITVDGVSNERGAMSLTDSETIVQYLKRHADMSIEERRRPQKGRITVDAAGSPVEIDLATAGTTSGQRMQFRVVQEVVQTKLESLGMPDDILGRARELVGQRAGLIIVSSRPGSGMTSTLYSLLRTQDAFMRQLVTLEMKPEVDLENITQKTYADPKGMSRALASILRRDPQVLAVDTCPDTDVAKQLQEAAMERMILLGLPAGDTFMALAKWIKLCGDARTAMAPLRAILCQVLLRKLCTKCREAYRPDPKLLTKANLPSKNVDRFYRTPTQPYTDEKGNPGICPNCRGSGYVGRTAAFELIQVTPTIREVVTSGATLADIKTACRREKMLYLQEQALRKVMDGTTSVQEVIRVTQKASRK